MAGIIAHIICRQIAANCPPPNPAWCLAGLDCPQRNVGINVECGPLADTSMLEFRWEVFNLVNRANFDLPANTTDGETIYSCPCTFDTSGKPVQKPLPDAGKIFSTVTDGRSFQLALRLMF